MDVCAQKEDTHALEMKIDRSLLAQDMKLDRILAAISTAAAPSRLFATSAVAGLPSVDPTPAAPASQCPGKDR
eukprot:9536958-Karenia_brevis.AAC.1